MSRIRKSAQGRACTVRIPGYCNFNPETTVLAHLPGGGMGRKRHDTQAAYACSSCHDVLDGRKKSDFDRAILTQWHMEAVFETQGILLEEGLILV